MKKLLKNTVTLLLLNVLLMLPGLVLAKGGPPVRVEQAIPGEGFQGEDLLVKIKGKGFESGASVRFLVADTEDDTQIEVKDVLYDPATGDLDTTITVTAEATVAYYDIDVRLSGNRGGKGTDLFKVQSRSGGNDNLVAQFCLNMDELVPGFGSDGNEYCDSKREKVMVATGSGPGFRFDSNSTNKAPNRTVNVNFPGGAVVVRDDSNNYLSTMFSTNYEINLRFNQKNGGLDLGALANPGGVGYVPIDLNLNSVDGIDHIGMSYSVDTVPFSHGYLTGQTCTSNNTALARVERISATAWTIESDRDNSNACLWDMNSDLLLQQGGTVVSMPFKFTITIIQ